MKPGGLKTHSQGFSDNSYPEPSQLNSLYWYLLLSHLRLGLSEGVFPVGLPVKKGWKNSYLIPIYLHDLPILSL